MSERAAGAPGRFIGRSVRQAIAGFDVHLRRANGVFEYSAGGDCILRVTLEKAAARVRLSDGAVIEPGDGVVELHFWNEHLPAMPSEGPNFAWANAFRRALNRSLEELAAAFETDPRFEEAKALRGRLASASRGQRETIRRFGAHFALETIPAADPPGLGELLADRIDDLWRWILLWTFNPPGLKGRTMVLRREEIWMSKATLMARYGPSAGAPAAARRRPLE